MNLVLLENSDLISNSTAVIKGEKLIHLNSVLKSKANSTITVGLYENKIGQGIVKSISQNEANIDFTLTQEPPPKLPIKLLCALPRPKTLKKVLHIATSIGVSEIYFFNSWKVEKSYWQSPVLKEESIYEHIKLGLEQAKDTVPPEVHFKKYFKPFVEDELPSIIKDTTAIIPHPYGHNNSEINISSKWSSIAIGPEGGFTEYEVDKLKEIGFLPISLGERILRVEFAIPTIIGKFY